MKKFSAVIISFNTKDILRKCLDSLFQHGGENTFEVIMVDNNSKDGSCEMIKQEFPQVHLVENEINRGFAAACNQALKHASPSEYLLLLNSDAELFAGSIDAALKFMDEHPSCGICAGRQIQPDGTLKPSARRFPSIWNKFLIMTGLSHKYPDSKFFGRPDYSNSDLKTAMEVDWVPGAFNIYRRSMLEQIGMFDERFFMYFEEVDLSLRAKKNGWATYFVPGAVISHIGGASSRTRQDLALDKGADLLKYRARSECLYYRKNFNILTVVGSLGIEILWYSIVYFYNLRSGREKCRRRRKEAKQIISHGIQALKDTRCGACAPPVPW